MCACVCRSVADYHALALRAADTGAYDEALRLFQLAQHQQPDDPAPSINAALTLAKANRAADALHVLDDVIGKDEHNGVAIFNYGNIALDIGRIAVSRPYFVRALELLPNSAVIRSGYGRWFMAQARYEEAAEHFRMALQMDPSLAGTYVNLGICLKETMHLQEAREAYERAAELLPGDPIPWYNLGSVYKDA